ncbi:MAG: ABC transporter permease [Candidatus Hydrogenedentota bacterium]
MNYSKIKQSVWITSFSAFVVIVLIAIGFLIITNVLFLGLSDFLYYAGESRTWVSFVTTLWTTTIATVLSMFIGVPVGYTLSRYKLPCSKLMKTLIDLPVMVPPVATGVFLLGVFKSVPLVNITQFLGIRIDHALPGVIVAQFTVTVSFCIRLVMASFDTISPRFEAVARSLGADLPYTFFKVSLPLAKNGLIASLIIVWARAVAEWGSLMLFVGGIQGRTDVMPFAVYLDFISGKIGSALTMSMLCILIAIGSMYAVYRVGGKTRVW